LLDRRASGTCLSEMSAGITPVNEKVKGKCDQQNFGCCSLTFERCGLESSCLELGHLTISFDGTKSTTAADTARLLSELDRVFSSEMHFATICDLRHGQPSPKLALSIGRFLTQERWARHVVSMALLISRNIFVACAQGVIGGILKMWFPSCPSIVCHCEHTAKKFFLAKTRQSAVGREFVSVVNVRKDCVDRQLSWWGTSYCNAYVAPLRPWDTSNIESTLHVLENGDVRVIQSPADDLIRDPLKAMHINIEDNPTKKALSALKFEGTERDLAQLIGTHFHIGELILDADIQSQNRHEELQRLHSNTEPNGCLDNALRVIGCLCGAEMASEMVADRPTDEASDSPKRLGK